MAAFPADIYEASQQNAFSESFFGVINQNLGTDLDAYNKGYFANAFPLIQEGLSRGIQSIDVIWENIVGIDALIDPNGEDATVFGTMNQLTVNTIKNNCVYPNKQSLSQIEYQDPTAWTEYQTVLAANFFNNRRNTMLNTAVSVANTAIKITADSINDHTADAAYKVSDALRDATQQYTNCQDVITSIAMPQAMYNKYEAELRSNERVEANIIGGQTYMEFAGIPIIIMTNPTFSSQVVGGRNAYTILLLTKSAVVINAQPLTVRSIEGTFSPLDAQQIYRFKANYSYEIAVKGAKYTGAPTIITRAPMETAANWEDVIANPLAGAGMKIAMAR